MTAIKPGADASLIARADTSLPSMGDAPELSPKYSGDASVPQASLEIPIARLKQRSPSDSKQKTTRHQRRQKGGKLRGSGRLKAMQREKASKVADDQRLLLESKIWHMRIAGWTTPEIGKALDVHDPSVIWQALDRWRKRLTDSIVDCAAIERYALIGAIEKSNKKLFTMLENDLNPAELSTVVNSIRGNVETIARMQGHNAPTEIISREVTATPEEARRLINERFAGAQAAELRKQLATGPYTESGSEPDPGLPTDKPTP